MARSSQPTRLSALSVGIAMTLAATLLAAPAHAFSPFGGTSSFLLDLQLVRWSISDFDDNLDNDVQPGEGLPITLEKGPGGFTDAEEDIIREAFAVWQNVDSAYAAFRYTLPITDPLELVSPPGSLFQVDGINLVAIQTGNDPIEVINPNVTFPVLGIALISFSIEDTFLQAPDGTTFPITGGRLVEADILFDAGSLRSPAPGVPPAADLLGTAVHEVGHLLGLGHVPLENLELDPILGPVETAVWVDRDVANNQVIRGVTPTMFPSTFSTDDGTGNVVAGGRDLAPDDIAGLRYLYPRRNGQGNFFTLNHFARTQSSQQIPSLPLLGGYVTAYADIDNDPFTPRVPILGTMTGLFEPNFEIQQRGNFELSGIPKELEHFGFAEPFQATYTFTIEPITASRFPFAVSGVTANPAAFDNTHGLLAGDGWPVPYDAFFPSEVFNKDGELFGAENFDAGTVLAWDPIRNRIVDAQTGERFSRMLPLDTPMFGDKSEVCPLNVAVFDTAIVALPFTLRAFRDDILMTHPLGAAFVDAYYAAGPDMAIYLQQNAPLLAAVRAALQAIEWVMINFDILVALLLIGYVLAWHRRRSLQAGLVVLLGASVLLSALPADAAIANVSEEEMVALADLVIEGRVTNVESILITQRPRVVTTITVEVQDSLKGRLNKGVSVFFELPVGRVGDFITASEELPTYQSGDRATFFFRQLGSGDVALLGGIRGSRAIFSGKDAEGKDTGEDRISFGPIEQEAALTVLDEKGYSFDETSLTDDSVPLEVYKTYIREIVRDQRLSARD